MEAVEVINVFLKGISDLKGIGYFTNLKRLNGDNNNLQTIDLSSNSALEELSLDSNPLSEINLSANESLRYLDLSGTWIRSLDEIHIGSKSCLQCLRFDYNELESIDVSGFKALTMLTLNGNKLTELDLSENEYLYHLEVNNNKLTSLDLSANYNISELDCYGNKLQIDAEAGGQYDLNKLPNFDVNKASEWNGGTVEGNILTVDPDATTVVYSYKTDSNRYDSSYKTLAFTLELSGSSGQSTSVIPINETNFPDKNFRYRLMSLSPVEPHTLDPRAVTSLNLSGAQIEDLTGIEHFPYLKELKCTYCGLKSLNLSSNTKLEYLDCSQNQLSSLDVSDYTNLKYLNCSLNQLSSLDVSNNENLETLIYYRNEIEINIGTDNRFDLSDLPGKFEKYKASDWNGGHLDGDVLVVDNDAKEVTYSYYVGGIFYKQSNFATLKVTRGEKVPTVTPTPPAPTATPTPPAPTATPTPPAPTTTPMPPVPTATPIPSEPTATPTPPAPTATPTPPEPTATPIPSEPTATPIPSEPTATPIPSEPIVIPPYVPVEPTPAPTEPPASPTPSPTVPDDQDSLKTKLEVEEGVQDVPEMLKEKPELNTPEKIEEKLKNVVSEISGYVSENAVSYDVSLSISNDSGKTWEKATPENFPMNGLLVTLPYPEGIDPAKYDFVVIHMFTTNHFGKVPGETEQPAVTKTKEGLQFRVTGLSPITVAWKEAEEVPEPTTVVPVIKTVKVTGNSAEVILSEKCEGMEGYDFVISKDPNCTIAKKYDKVSKNIRTEKTTFRYIKKGTYYAYCHAWKKVDGKKKFTGWSEAYPFKINAVTPDRPVITSVKVSGSTVKVTYKVSKNAEGYDVVLGKSVKKEFDGEKRPVEYGKLVKKNNKKNVLTVTFKNVPKGTYYAGLHAFNKTSNNGKKAFSPWSAAKKITVK